MALTAQTELAMLAAASRLFSTQSCTDVCLFATIKHGSMTNTKNCLKFRYPVNEVPVGVPKRQTGF